MDSAMRARDAHVYTSPLIPQQTLAAGILSKSGTETYLDARILRFLLSVMLAAEGLGAVNVSGMEGYIELSQCNGNKVKPVTLK
ncbi:hypothetical protein N7488_002783 [Penicillium malachiteum]|nr:hypothetical protein N7488_002783 [Penicillium malachiteum]